MGVPGGACAVDDERSSHPATLRTAMMMSEIDRIRYIIGYSTDRGVDEYAGGTLALRLAS